jgi:FkbM family methyltransferase
VIDIRPTYKEILLGNLKRLSYMQDLVTMLFFYHSKFSNPLSVIMKNKYKKYPIIAKLKDKDTKIIENFGKLLSVLYDFDYDHEKDIVSLNNLNYNIKLFSAIGNGEIIGVFYKKDYGFLDVKDKTVIDIGANIADSSIYFALEGASTVIALEPYVKNSDIARHNIDLNNLSSKIILIQSGCSSKEENLMVDSDYSGVFKPLLQSKNGKTIKLMTLQSIMERFHIETAVLKMDCEGCEYDVILNASKNILKRFSQIQIEYHYGYHTLKTILSEIGFEVSVTTPRFRFNKFAEKKDMYVGWLYAKNIQKF